MLELADYVASTGQMFEVVEKEVRKVFLVGTEEGMLYPLKNRFPGRRFIPVRTGVICKDMKKITIDNVIESMKTLSPRINIPEEVTRKASIALKRMLDVS